MPYTAVTVEFPGEVPPKSFARLLEHLAFGAHVPIDPLRYPDLPTAPSIVDQARYWADHLGTGTGPFVLLGYCAAAPLIRALVRELGERRRPVALAAVWDPMLLTMSQVRDAVEESARAIDPSATAPVPVFEAADAATVHARTHLTALVTASLGELPPDVLDQLLYRYLAWIGYLLSASVDGGWDAGVPHLALRSDEALPDGEPVGWSSTIAVGGRCAEAMAAPAAVRAIASLLPDVSTTRSALAL